MTTRKPRIEYRWRSRFEGGALVHDCTWSLYGANHEYMCGSGSEGYRDKAAARAAVYDVMRVFGCLNPGSTFPLYVREVGPGRKP